MKTNPLLKIFNVGWTILIPIIVGLATITILAIPSYTTQMRMMFSGFGLLIFGIFYIGMINLIDSMYK